MPNGLNTNSFISNIYNSKYLVKHINSLLDYNLRENKINLYDINMLII